jgi:hypothetical protein
MIRGDQRREAVVRWPIAEFVNAISSRAAAISKNFLNGRVALATHARYSDEISIFLHRAPRFSAQFGSQSTPVTVC